MFNVSSSRTWVVTGATGFVGEHLTRLLIAQGEDVVAVGGKNALMGVGRSVRVDLTDRGAVVELVREVRPWAVVHCAAATDVAYCQREPEAARQAIVGATVHVVAALREGAPGARLLALSTDLVFDGESPPYSEGSPVGPVNVYGVLKCEAEASVLESPGGLVLRSSLVYGPATTYRVSFLGWIVDSLRRKQPLGLFHDEVRTPVFVGDLCGAILRLVREGQTGLWHCGGGERLDRATMGRVVCQALGCSEGLIQPQSRAESTYPAVRPRDVSLDSTKLWGYLGAAPIGFATGLERSGIRGGL